MKKKTKSTIIIIFVKSEFDKNNKIPDKTLI